MNRSAAFGVGQAGLDAELFQLLLEFKRTVGNMQLVAYEWQAAKPYAPQSPVLVSPVRIAVIAIERLVQGFDLARIFRGDFRVITVPRVVAFLALLDVTAQEQRAILLVLGEQVEGASLGAP